MHMKRLFWALRKIRLPISSRCIVLDIGSGDNPHPRSDILLDRLSGREHRSGAPMLIDRPAVIGDAMHLPFKDKSFDFVIASHILEHISDPVSFLQEIERVGKAGYIETPNSLYEKLNPSMAHCLEVDTDGDSLLIYKKSSAITNQSLKELDLLSKNEIWKKLAISDPALFHTRYYWKDKIKYRIVNPETSCDWVHAANSLGGIDGVATEVQNRTGWRKFGIRLMNSYYCFTRKLRLDSERFYSFLVCPVCRRELIDNNEAFKCNQCNKLYTKVPFINFEETE